MKALLLIAALSSLPAFEPEISTFSRPLLWETPISVQAAPPSVSPGLTLSPALTARIKEARAIQEKSGPLAAASHLDKAAEVELILLRASYRRQAGQLKSAQADYEKVLASKNRTAPRALALEGYKNILKARIAAGEKNLYWDLVKCLKDEWRNEEALNLLPVVWADPQVSDEIKKRIIREEPIMALRLGRYQRAAELWANPKDRSETQWLAQTENRRGNFMEASALREKLAGKRELETAWTILVKGGLYDEAEALAGRHAEIKKLPDYHWYSGLAALASNRLVEAETSFEALLAQSKNKNRQAGARYFLARTQELAGKAAEASANYGRLVSGPFGYYHILAQARLVPGPVGPTGTGACLVCESGEFNEKTLQTAEALATLLDSGPDGNNHGSLGYWLWLTEKGLGLDELEAAAGELAGLKGPILAGGKSVAALNEEVKGILAGRDYTALFRLLLDNTEALRSATPDSRELWLPLIATVAANGGDYRLAVSLMSRIPSPDTSKSLKRWSHPLIFGREVREAHRLYGLAPSLTLALIRTESAYQSDIMSASNARGLMQLLPATANKVAAAMGEHEPGALALFSPSLNIRYGTWYLAALVEGFGSVELALAGYNGGPYNIKSLILAKEGLPLDIFIETLSFEETSLYVKRITESRYIYEMVYLGRARLPELTVPVRAPGPSLPGF